MVCEQSVVSVPDGFLVDGQRRGQVVNQGAVEGGTYREITRPSSPFLLHTDFPYLDTKKD